MKTKEEALKMLSDAITAATESGLFDNEMLGAVANAESINDFCDAISYLENNFDS